MMIKSLVSFSETGMFPQLITDYLSDNLQVKPFYFYQHSIHSFEEAMKNRRAQPVNRQVLCHALKRQYSGKYHSGSWPVIEKQIELLSQENTYTVTTGHQLNIFTGPLYYIYKIVSTIKLASELKSRYPDNNFVPVFWMASEDHDFDEINHCRIYGKDYTWKHTSGGPVGRLDTAGLAELGEELKSVFNDPPAIIDQMTGAYKSAKTLAEATRTIAHDLFAAYGLVVLDGDDAGLKQLFVGEMQTELFEHKTFSAVERTNADFGKNYKVQVTPREINLFYMEDTIRERILLDDDGLFHVQNTSLVFNRGQITEELNSYPERFSPNVVTRPLYQEKILPNLAYIGGPGEVNYWLQFKSAFEVSKIPFPVVLMRNCFLIIDKASERKLEKLAIAEPELFQSTDYLILKILESATDIHPGTGHLIPAIDGLFNTLAVEYEKLDPTLVPAVEAEKQKVFNALNNLEAKAKRSLKRKNEITVNQLTSIKDKLFPDGRLQERVDNVIPYLLEFPDLIDRLIEASDAVVEKFCILKPD